MKTMPGGGEASHAWSPIYKVERVASRRGVEWETKGNLLAEGALNLNWKGV